MRELLATVAIVLATLATLAFVVPQAVKLIRTGDTAGVSATWPAFGAVANLGWLAYFIHEELWLSIPAAAGALVGYLITIWAMRRSHALSGASGLRGGVFALVLLATTVAWGWTALGVVLGLSFAVMMGPAIWSAFAVPDPSGIAPGTWWLGVAEALLWGFYGWHHADAGLIVFAVTAAIGSAVMLGRYYATRPGTPQSQPAR